MNVTLSFKPLLIGLKTHDILTELTSSIQTQIPRQLNFNPSFILQLVAFHCPLQIENNPYSALPHTFSCKCRKTFLFSKNVTYKTTSLFIASTEVPTSITPNEMECGCLLFTAGNRIFCFRVVCHVCCCPSRNNFLWRSQGTEKISLVSSVYTQHFASAEVKADANVGVLADRYKRNGELWSLTKEIIFVNRVWVIKVMELERR